LRFDPGPDSLLAAREAIKPRANPKRGIFLLYNQAVNACVETCQEILHFAGGPPGSPTTRSFANRKVLQSRISIWLKKGATL
jgi:hypothetical protein